MEHYQKSLGSAEHQKLSLEDQLAVRGALSTTKLYCGPPGSASRIFACFPCLQATITQNTRIVEESRKMEEELVAVLDEKDKLEERLGPASDQEALQYLVQANPQSELVDLWSSREWHQWRGVRLSGAGRVMGLALSDRRITKLCQIMHQLSSLELLHLDYNQIKVSWRQTRPGCLGQARENGVPFARPALGKTCSPCTCWSAPSPKSALRPPQSPLSLFMWASRCEASWNRVIEWPGTFTCILKEPPRLSCPASSFKRRFLVPADSTPCAHVGPSCRLPATASKAALLHENFIRLQLCLSNCIPMTGARP